MLAQEIKTINALECAYAEDASCIGGKNRDRRLNQNGKTFFLKLMLVSVFFIGVSSHPQGGIIGPIAGHIGEGLARDNFENHTPLTHGFGPDNDSNRFIRQYNQGESLTTLPGAIFNEGRKFVHNIGNGNFAHPFQPIE